MSKRLKVYIIRIVAVCLVVFMVVGMFSNVLSGFFNQSSTQTTTASKYKYVSEENKVKLNGVNQTILLPANMEVQGETVNDEIGAISANYGSINVDGKTIAIMITRLESAENDKVSELGMVTKSEMSEQSQSIESEDAGYYLFQGEENNYMETIKLIPSNNENFSFMVSYTIFDLENQNYYMVTLYLTSPKSPSKTDMKTVENMGKEMMSLTKYPKYEVTSQFAVPGEKEDLFNH